MIHEGRVPNSTFASEKEPQFVPPAILLVLLAFGNLVRPFADFFISESLQSNLYTITAIATAALIIERAVELAFRKLESQTDYVKSEFLEKMLKSTILLVLAIAFYDEPVAEELFSSIILLVVLSLSLIYIRSFNTHLLLRVFIDSWIVGSVIVTLYAVWFGVLNFI